MEFDGVNVIVLDRPIWESDVKVICAGVGSYDGETYSVLSVDGDSIALDDAVLDAVERPLTGVWKKKYPDFKWYIVANHKVHHTPSND